MSAPNNAAAAPNEAAAAAAESTANLLQQYSAKEIDNAKLKLGCPYEKCLKTFIDCSHYYKLFHRANDELKRLKLMANNNDHAKIEELKAEISQMAAKIKVLETNANLSVPNEMPKTEVVQNEPASSQESHHHHQLPAAAGPSENISKDEDKDDVIYVGTSKRSNSSAEVPSKAKKKRENVEEQQQGHASVQMSAQSCSNEAAKAKMDKAKEEADEEEKGGLSEQQENSISEEEGRAAIQQLAAIKKLALALVRKENGKTKKSNENDAALANP